MSAMKIESPGGFSAGAFPPDSRRMRSSGSTDCILLGISFGGAAHAVAELRNLDKSPYGNA
jgi:hypothetical protein